MLEIGQVQVFLRIGSPPCMCLTHDFPFVLLGDRGSEFLSPSSLNSNVGCHMPAQQSLPCDRTDEGADDERSELQDERSLEG